MAKETAVDILDKISDEEAEKILTKLRAQFNPKERATIAALKKLVKDQEVENQILRDSLSMSGYLGRVQTFKPPRLKRQRAGKSRKAFQLHLSDTHSRELVSLAQTGGRNEHSVEIGRERLRSIVVQAEKLLKEEARTCEPAHFTVWGGGDWMVNADLHYKMERCVDDEPLVEMGHVYEMLKEELGWLWGRVPTDSNSFVGSFSNHGRDSEKIIPGLESARSYDTFVYKQLENDFTDVSFNVAETTWSIEDIGGFSTMYTHGHNNSCKTRRTTEGIMVPNWEFMKRMRMDYEFNGWVQGHQHTKSVLLSNRFAHMQNGSLVGENSYATSLGYPGEPPSQNMAVINLDLGVVEKVVTLYS